MAWRRTHIGHYQDDGQVGGLPVWKHEWRPLEGEVRLPEDAPSGSQQTFHVYEMGGAGWPVQVRFAARENSNGFWSFWEEV